MSDGETVVALTVQSQGRRNYIGQGCVVPFPRHRSPMSMATDAYFVVRRIGRATERNMVTRRAAALRAAGVPKAEVQADQDQYVATLTEYLALARAHEAEKRSARS